MVRFSGNMPGKMHATLEKLLSHGPVLTDGAWGTQLQARGLAVGEFPDLWNLTHAERVLEVARAYVDAGSRIILTNTFGANSVRMADHAAADQVEAINRRGVEISREAAAGRAAVFASIGPSGKLLLSGEVSEEELRAAFTEQARALAAAGADGLVIETMTELMEAKIALGAARQTGLPVVVCMVFDSGRDKDRTMMGDTPEQVGAVLAREGADVVGANCGQGIEAFPTICRRLRGASDRPLWLKPNAGRPRVVEGKVHYDASPEGFAEYVPELLRLGASFLGGCCGTSPDFIQAAGAKLRAVQTGRAA